MMGRRERCHNASVTKELNLDRRNKRTEKEMITSTTIELGKRPSKKVWTELLDYQQRKG